MSKRRQVITLIFLMLLGACKQSEFYQKEKLSEILTPPEQGIAPDPTGDTGTSGTNGGLGSIGITPPAVNPVPITNPAGVTLISHTESFIQKANRNGDVDILWVIDDSGSMADNQSALAANFQSFIDQFLTKNINFKMAITTTDGGSSRKGKMVGDSNLLTASAAQTNKAAFLNNFSKWVKVGTSGSGIEQGLKCASSFFDRYSTSFLRPDAYLAIVFLSDEEDQSDKRIDYINNFLVQKPNQGMVKAYSIVTQVVPKNAQWESEGARYNLVSKATNGLSADITSNFATTLQSIGGAIVNLIDRFALVGTPYNNTVEVYVNNIKQSSGWSYDAATKSVKFSAGKIPVDGSNIEIKYMVPANLLGSI